ncbi:uncharacterized protein [Physcomitrium patens]|uniref:FAS1 domain-containing protein n=1 Tax=Physcomitrium patens TaxID=3218 RepID=A9S3B7_PHYPA|nr:FAS1 domain-containing protein SELMODRAFT_448915-like [Physcomitrium patens]XP_024368887.1 FAS1 domain-containing protein SELMODRAFT_448915-like [Physcomitrium patens]XP_024368897.1 FAS1 domain-containing protein SELMODRAFT_448915-like [Physcomitrium patens]XP_024368906.1 FAS1 domain-containing protein SELMODRAFT_448915-like [Physcomitrium patens]XP_024368917.1 FAS1 domain-containing protein SELMODRAFT_448915-like [Physcomitrium patens]XP_024368925.1 FAS1 domain-containing protein SELMODRAF|eukprot:XP_024368879.1 FAS1 domain-containing protein SELMODRAFT_448915-like [Physcomitrella patens]
MAGVNLFPSLRGAQLVFNTMVCFTLLLPLALGTVASESLVTAAASKVPAVPVPAPVRAPAPAPKILTLHEKVVTSLRSAGHYGAIAGLLDSLPNNNIIKTGMTLLAPNDNAFSNVLMNSTTYLTTLLTYHGAAKVYSYEGLLNLPVGTKIPSTAANVVIVVTSNSKGAYKLDDSQIVDPDIFVDNTVAVHGIDNVLNTAKYNKGVVAPEAAPAPVDASPIAPARAGPPAPPGSIVNPGGSGGDATDGPSYSPDSTPQLINPNGASVVPKSSLLDVSLIALWLFLIPVLAW